jgi:putative sterol carrier protein
MPPTKDQIKQFYRAGLERCLSDFAKIEDRDWGRKVSEWTAQEHLASIVATTEAETLTLTKQTIAGEPNNVPGFEKRSDMMSFRAESMKGLRDQPVPDLLARLKSDIEEHIAMLDSISEADLDKPAMSPTWDHEGTLRDLFLASYLFLAAQYQEIRKANKKKLNHWVQTDPDMVNFHMGRIFHYMPLVFNRDKGADTTATYQFTMEGAGGGQWSIAIADGQAKSSDGGSDPHDCEIKTKPEHWIDLTTGELNAVTAIMPGPFRKVAINGNMGLAMKLSDLFSAEG